MTKISVYGDKAKELMKYGAYGTFKADGMSFTITKRSSEGHDIIDLDIEEIPI